MKRTIFIAVLAVLSLTSCQKDELYVTQNTDTRSVIGFSSYMEKMYTKANVSDLTSTSSFKVMAYIGGKDTAYFQTLQTAAKQPSGVYTTPDTYYWPTAKGLDFYAYHSPKGASVELQNSAGTASVVYHTPSNADDDFIVAYQRNKKKSTAKDTAGCKALSLDFKHIMANVNQVALEAKPDGVSNDDHYRFCITDVKIINVKDTAIYTYYNKSTLLSEYWSGLGGNAQYTFNKYNTLATAKRFTGDQTEPLYYEDGIYERFYFIPQALTFQITYSVEYRPEGAYGWTEVMGSTVKTAVVDVSKGKSYNITLQLTNDASPVTFVINTINEWNTPTEIDVPQSILYIEDGHSYGPGVFVDGVIWAPVNCGVGADSSTTHGFGLLYQFGRKVGTPADSTITLMDKTLTFADGATGNPYSFGIVGVDTGYLFYGNWFDGYPYYNAWNLNNPEHLSADDPSIVALEPGRKNPLYDPCPEGWRVPTRDELASLVYVTGYNFSTHVAVSPMTRRGEYDEATKSWIFNQYLSFPCAGFRHDDKGLFSLPTYGFYWSCSSDIEGPSYEKSAVRHGTSCMKFAKVNATKITPPEVTCKNPSCGMSIRCVQE